jgi:hypothetical protein
MNSKSVLRMVDASGRSIILRGLQSSGSSAPVWASMSLRSREKYSWSELLKTTLVLSAAGGCELDTRTIETGVYPLSGKRTEECLVYGGGVSAVVGVEKKESGTVLDW